MKSNYTKKKFKENSTKVYHEKYGKGIFVCFKNASSTKPQEYIYIKFSGNDEPVRFRFPNDFENGNLSLKQNEDQKNRDAFMNTAYGKAEFLNEKKHYDVLMAEIDKDFKSSRTADEINSISFSDSDFLGAESLKNDYAKTFDSTPDIHKIKVEPYFARVDYFENKETHSIYFGKYQYRNDVIDSRDPLAALYYNYKNYINSKNRKIEIVRDIGAHDGFHSIYDRYNTTIGKKTGKKDDNIITDPYLLKIIELQKEEKQAHDIIKTIQDNQYAIISADFEKDILVAGCAGSGKTVIMMHRLSYLEYNRHHLLNKNNNSSHTNRFIKKRFGKSCC